jgi:hypothetical protein
MNLSSFNKLGPITIFVLYTFFFLVFYEFYKISKGKMQSGKEFGITMGAVVCYACIMCVISFAKHPVFMFLEWLMVIIAINVELTMLLYY